MNAISQALFNAIIQSGAILPLPVIPAVTADQNSSTSNSDGTATPNRNTDSERRERMNELFAELYNLIRKEGDGKMSQANILKAALKACIETKRGFHSDFHSRGLNAALAKIQQLTIQHLKSLNLPYPNSQISVQRLKKLFEDFWDVVLPVFTPKAAPAKPAVLPKSDTGACSSKNANEARKEVKKNREQDRRDCHADGFGLLRQFIDENHVFSRGNQQIQVLETIIRYLRNTPSIQPSQTEAAEIKIGFSQGRILAQNVAISFFKSDAHFSSHFDGLENLFISHLGPLDSSSHMTNFQFDKTAIMNFISIHPAIFDFNDIIPPAPVPQAVSFWRPWKKKTHTVHP